MLTDNGEQYLQRYGKGTKGAGWYSFDHKGVHFVGLVNVVNLKAGGLGSLGHEQLEWLEDDLKGRSASTPIVLFAHIPLWTIYPDWGWGTDDSEQALSYVKRFGSVTVLNGHIHQVMQKIEGKVSFHTAMSTAFPQPAPGTCSLSGAHESASRPATTGVGNYRCQLPGQRQQLGNHRLATRQLELANVREWRRHRHGSDGLGRGFDRFSN